VSYFITYQTSFDISIQQIELPGNWWMWKQNWIKISHMFYHKITNEKYDELMVGINVGVWMIDLEIIHKILRDRYTR
jgi:hypothetical protein